MKKFWRVSYRGLWMGGEAIVVASTAEEAIAAVSAHKLTVNFENATAKEIETPEDGVLHNDNGDY